MLEFPLLTSVSQTFSKALCNLQDNICFLTHTIQVIKYSRGEKSLWRLGWVAKSRQWKEGVGTTVSLFWKQTNRRKLQNLLLTQILFRGVRHPKQKEIIDVCVSADVRLRMRSDWENWRLGYDRVAHDQTQGHKMHKKCLRATRSRQRHKAVQLRCYLCVDAHLTFLPGSK